MTTGTTGETTRRRLLLLAPAGVVLAGGAAFWAMLRRMETGKFDPHSIGDPMRGKPIPDFDLPAMPPGIGFTAADLRKAAASGPILLNFFASWCIPCAAEADLLGDIAKTVPVWGVTYKDAPGKIAGFLQRNGNPYARIGTDTSGMTFINFGCYGVPETFLIGRDGRIAWHLGGPLTEDTIRDQLKPALKAAA